jgi:hypothetical protein
MVSQIDDFLNDPQIRLFLSYSRRDASDLARRLRVDLEARGFTVWQDTRQIRAGNAWEEDVQEAIRSTHVFIAILSPQAVRQGGSSERAEQLDSTCLDEIYFARYISPSKPIVPVMAIRCQPPFSIFRLDYVDMTHWATSEELYQRGIERLLEGIEAGLRGEPPPYRRWHRQLHVLDFADYLDHKRQDFIGRQWLFNEIVTWQRTHEQERTLLIYGDPGVGKTAMMAQFVHLHRERVLAYHCCRAERFDSFDPGVFVQSLAGMIANGVPAYAEHVEGVAAHRLLDPREFHTDLARAFEEIILEPLKQVKALARGVRYILVDALDEALNWSSNPTIVDLLAQYADRFPSWVRVVATSRRVPKVQTLLSRLRAINLDADSFACSNKQDIDAFIRHRLQSAELKERLAGSGQSVKRIQERVQEAVAGNFLYAKQILIDIERDIYHLDRLDQFPQGLAGYYYTFFERSFKGENEYTSIRHVLEVLVAAREPLTEQQVVVASGLDSDYELPSGLATFAEFLDRQIDNAQERYRIFVETKSWNQAELPEALVNRRSGHQEVLSLFHASLADWLDSPLAHRFRISRRRGHTHLADMCWEEYCCGIRGMSLYAFRFLFAHLREAKRWEELGIIATDFRYLAALMKAGLLSDLVDELRETPKATTQSQHLEPIQLTLQFLHKSGWDCVQHLDYAEGLRRIRFAFGLTLTFVRQNPAYLPWLLELFESARNRNLRNLMREGLFLPINDADYFWLIQWLESGLEQLTVSGLDLDDYFLDWLREIKNGDFLSL